MLTAIIPIDLKRRPSDLVNKAISLARKAQENNTKLIFGHNNRNTKYDKKLINELNKFPSSKIKSIDNNTDVINSSQLRNIAYSEVESEYVILLDVDILPDFNLFTKYLNKLIEKRSKFYIIPCLYLTKYGTNLINTGTISIEKLKEKYFNFSRKEFLHMASPSSITIMRTEDYFFAGSFDEDFKGHGFEDFDFLIRLALLHNSIDMPADFLVDKPARSPLFAVGFRKYLGKLCMEILLEKDMAFHLYHEKDNDDNYYKARTENYIKFSDKYINLLKVGHPKDPTLITNFISLCVEKDLSAHKYSILFDNKPGHIDRYDTIKKKLRFLFK